MLCSTRDPLGVNEDAPPKTILKNNRLAHYLMSAHLHPSLLPLLIALKYIPFPISLTWMIRRTWIATSKQGGLGLLEWVILIQGLLTRNHLTFTWGEVILFISTHKYWPLGEGFLRHNLAIGAILCNKLRTFSLNSFMLNGMGCLISLHSSSNEELFGIKWGVRKAFIWSL